MMVLAADLVALPFLGLLLLFPPWEGSYLLSSGRVDDFVLRFSSGIFHQKVGFSKSPLLR
jgi:hypothetical protein